MLDEHMKHAESWAIYLVQNSYSPTGYLQTVFKRKNPFLAFEVQQIEFSRHVSFRDIGGWISWEMLLP